MTDTITLLVPEDLLQEYITVIREGLRHTHLVDGFNISTETKKKLSKWCSRSEKLVTADSITKEDGTIKRYIHGLHSTMSDWTRAATISIIHQEAMDGEWVKWEDVEHLIIAKPDDVLVCNCKSELHDISTFKKTETTWICPAHGYKRR